MKKNKQMYPVRYPNLFEESLIGELWVFLKKEFEIRKHEGPGFSVEVIGNRNKYVFSSYVARDYGRWLLQIEDREKDFLIRLGGDKSLEEDLSSVISELRENYPSCFLQSALDVLIHDTEDQ